MTDYRHLPLTRDEARARHTAEAMAEKKAVSLPDVGQRQYRYKNGRLSINGEPQPIRFGRPGAP